MLSMNTIDNRSYSVELDGVDEQFYNDTEQVLGFANAWSVGVWLKPGVGAINGNDVIADFQTDDTNRVLFMTRGGTGSGKMRWSTVSSVSVDIKIYDWLSILVQDSWEFHVGTWDGTDLLAYKNGSDLGPPDNPITDDSGTMTDTARRAALGARTTQISNFDGRLHSCMVWNVALGPTEISTVYNGGNGAQFNPQMDSGDYASSNNLVHWWRLGKDRSDIGADYTVVGNPINVGQDATDISVDDIVADAPVS